MDDTAKHLAVSKPPPNRTETCRYHQTPVALTTAASGSRRPRIMSDALSAIIIVEALRLAEIMRGMMDVSSA